MLELLTDPQAWIALATLLALEIVLGVDNVVFISILAGKLPASQQRAGAPRRTRARDGHAHPAAALALLDHPAHRAAVRGARARDLRAAT